MEIKDLRTEQKVEIEEGDVIRGNSGNYYLIIRSSWKFNLLNLRSSTLFHDDGYSSIEEAVYDLLRDSAKTLIKSDQITLTFS
jgi:hypothetical protein